MFQPVPPCHFTDLYCKADCTISAHTLIEFHINGKMNGPNPGCYWWIDQYTGLWHLQVYARFLPNPPQLAVQFHIVDPGMHFMDFQAGPALVPIGPPPPFHMENWRPIDPTVTHDCWLHWLPIAP